MATLVHEMQRLGARLGVATMCIGMGQCRHGREQI